MQVIYKYPVYPDSIQAIPADPKFLHVAYQGEYIFAWALVNPRHPPKAYKFKVYGTGYEANINPSTYIGTVHDDKGPGSQTYVWHIFYEPL